jgi:hypothetical protein
VNRRALVTIVGAAVALRLVLLATRFAYASDVYYHDTLAVKALLFGSNPYGHHYVVPLGLATPRA